MELHWILLAAYIFVMPMAYFAHGGKDTLDRVVGVILWPLVVAVFWALLPFVATGLVRLPEPRRPT